MVSWLGQGGYSEGGGAFPADAALHSHRFVRSATERTFRLMNDAKTGPQEPVALFDYAEETERGDHCIIDVELSRFCPLTKRQLQTRLVFCRIWNLLDLQA